MKLTIEILKKHKACQSGIDWFLACGETEVRKVCLKLLSEGIFCNANWLISRLLKHDDKTRYAIYAASLVLETYEKKYPGDNRPRAAIKAAKAYLKNKTAKNKKILLEARAAAYDAAYAAAYAAAAAAAAAYAADADDAAAYDAADAAAYAAAAAAAKDVNTKIIKYGLRLLYRGAKSPSEGRRGSGG